jgi:hypothetical protein
VAFKPGKNFGVKWNALDLTAYLDKGSLERITELIETTTMSTSSAVYATRLAGILDVKVAVSGPYDPAIESTVGLETDSAAGTARAVKVQMDTSGSASATNPSYTMTMLADGFKLDTDVKGRVNWSANFMMASGSVTRGVASVAW